MDQCPRVTGNSLGWAQARARKIGGAQPHSEDSPHLPELMRSLTSVRTQHRVASCLMSPGVPILRVSVPGQEEVQVGSPASQAPLGCPACPCLPSPSRSGHPPHQGDLGDGPRLCWGVTPSGGRRPQHSTSLSCSLADLWAPDPRVARPPGQDPKSLIFSSAFPFFPAPGTEPGHVGPWVH